MSTFKGHAKSLSEQYVYYKRLKTDNYYPRLAKYVSNASWRIFDQTKKYAADASAVRMQAQAEFLKEKALLQSKFGVNLSFDYYRGREDFKEIIDALNVCLNLKEVYERNVQLAKTTKGMKGVYSWYPTYFMHAWQVYWPKIKSSFERQFLKGIDATSALSSALDKYLPQVCILGIEKMLDGPEVEASSIDRDLKNAYKSLVAQIGKVEDAGSVANQIYNAYQLDELKQGLINELSIKDNRIYAKDMKPKVKQMISKNIHSRGGLSLEAIENAIFSQIAGSLKGTAIHSGSTQIKADNILSIDIDPTMIVETLEKAGANREENIQALSALGTKLSKLDDGFIVYSSDKNYSLNANFSGFGAGSVGANAASFLNNVYKGDSSVFTLIGTIQQLGEGAMLEKQKEPFEQLLAQDVAYMLFDDFTTIGVADTSGKAIHVMNLNGILMPMSVILSLLADAIESINTEEIRKIVNVNIKAPPILYPKQKDQERAWPNNAPGAWEHQRQYALSNTKISAKFLKDFKNLIIQFL